NRASIEDAIRSVLSQTYRDVEYIVIDGNSTDGTVDAVKKYTDKITAFVSQKDHGIYDAMNKGLRLVTGDIIGILNSDDVYADARVLETVVMAMQDEKICACYGDL